VITLTFLAFMPVSISSLFNDAMLLLWQGRLDRLDGWHRIASLEVLSLSHNKLQGPLPTEIVHLPSLKVLNLACNKFDGAVKAILYFYQKYMLKEINSEYCFRSCSASKKRNTACALEGVMMWHTVSGFTNDSLLLLVAYAICSVHSMSYFIVVTCIVCCVQVPEEWGSLKKLTHLWLFANQLTGPALPSSVATISGATALESLRLSRNKFTGQVRSIVQ
jgi:Leucine-rich repeat (LRR) protein